MHFTIVRDEGALVVFPDHEKVRNFLTLKHREMVKVGGQTRFENHEDPLWNMTTVEGGQAALISHQGFWQSLQKHLTMIGHKVEVRDVRTKLLPEPNLRAAIIGLRPWQAPWIVKALITGNSGLIGGPTRFGKCLSPVTPVMFADGTTKPASDVKVGDQLMGPDSKPRTVLNCVEGREAMFRITPNKGEPFDCTGDHYLVLKRTQDGTQRAGEEIAITVDDYSKKSRWFKHTHKLIHAAVEFPKVATKVDPYCFGMWVGDGHADKPGLTSDDPPLVKLWKDEASRHGLRAVHNDRHRSDSTVTVIMRKLHGTNTKGISREERGNTWMGQVREATPDGIKRIPKEFRINDRSVRLAVLAGIIDTDGYVCNGKAYAVVWKHRETAEDLVALGRSLGFRCTLRAKERSAHATHCALYYEVIITGALDLIPVVLERKKIKGLKNRTNPLTTGFQVSSVGVGDYYGFELSGDRKFLLGSFLVTHNSYGMTAICRAFPSARTVITAPGVDLCEQLSEHFKEVLPHRDIKAVYTGSRNKTQGADITICSIDSLDKMDPDDTDLLIVDEPHAVVSDSRKDKIALFNRSRKYGFGATLKGRFDKKDRLIEGLIGPVISNITYREAVDMGAIAPMKVLVVKVPFSKDTVPGNRVDRAIVYKRLLTHSTRTAGLVRKILHEVIPDSWQTMAFIQNEKQALFYMEHAILPENHGAEGDEEILEAAEKYGTIAMAKRLTNKVRKLVTAKIAAGDILRVLASNIYVQGVTFPDLKVVINLAGGGANTTAIQKPGRLLQTRPGKKYGVMIDILFECRDAALDARSNPPYKGVVGECHARIKAYEEIGYDVHYVADAAEAAEIIRGAYE